MQKFNSISLHEKNNYQKNVIGCKILDFINHSRLAHTKKKNITIPQLVFFAYMRRIVNCGLLVDRLFVRLCIAGTKRFIANCLIIMQFSIVYFVVSFFPSPFCMCLFIIFAKHIFIITLHILTELSWIGIKSLFALLFFYFHINNGLIYDRSISLFMRVCCWYLCVHGASTSSSRSRRRRTQISNISYWAKKRIGRRRGISNWTRCIYIIIKWYFFCWVIYEYQY